MARRHTPQPLRTGGGAWGRERVRLGISIRELERRSGVSRAALSFAEQGRLVPKAEEWEAVQKVLREQEAVLTTGGSPPGAER